MNTEEIRKKVAAVLNVFILIPKAEEIKRKVAAFLNIFLLFLLIAAALWISFIVYMIISSAVDALLGVL